MGPITPPRGPWWPVLISVDFSGPSVDAVLKSTLASVENQFSGVVILILFISLHFPINLLVL
jgi:hypothetical protein